MAIIIAALISQEHEPAESQSRDYALVREIRQEIENGVVSSHDRPTPPVDTTGRLIMMAIPYLQ